MPTSTRKLVGAVVMKCDASGKVDVDEHGDGRVRRWRRSRRTAASVVGLFALAAPRRTASGRQLALSSASSTRSITRRSWASSSSNTCRQDFVRGRRGRSRPLGRQGRVALVKSDKRINKAIDAGDYDELQKAMAQSSDEVSGRCHVLAHGAASWGPRRPELALDKRACLRHGSAPCCIRDRRL